MEEDIAVATPPIPPKTPEPPVTLAEKLGLDERSENESLETFLAKLETANPVPLKELKTAVEKAEEEQLILDKANEAILYKEPKEMKIKKEPEGVQVINKILEVKKPFLLFNRYNNLLFNLLLSYQFFSPLFLKCTMLMEKEWRTLGWS